MTSRPLWDANTYDDRYAFIFERGRDLLDELAPEPSERILEIGAGTGHVAQTLRDRGAHVVGIDASPEMVARGRARYPELDLRVADARELPFDCEFDAAFSNATLHWISPPGQAAASIARALKPGARFVAEMGGEGNCRLLIGAMQRAIAAEGLTPVPYGLYFPGIAEYSRVLEEAGFEVVRMWLFDRPTPLEGERGLEDWIRMFSTHVLARVDAGAAARAIRRAEEELRPSLFREGRWIADYRRLRFEAIKRADRITDAR